MARVLVAALVAMIIAILSGPTFISFLRRNEFGQHIREEMPEGHLQKQGTPTMGGLLVMLAATIAFLPLSAFTTPALTVFGTMLACGAVGFLDDFTKLRQKRSLGLQGRWKMVFLILITAAVGIAAHHQRLSHSVFIPILDKWLPLGPGWYVLLFLIIAGAVNGVNLTDGLDGLAAGCCAIVFLTFTAMTFITKGEEDLALLCACLVGACVGFLWFNSFPASVFMGDTGSLGLGGAIAALAVVTKTEVLLIVIGGIFVIEALSVAIQVIAFQRFRKRVFLMAPIHHHFELMAWSETKIILRFWIVAAICAAIGFTLYQQSIP
jgi:phospho-N-acetylmuramoyl-pentapeptide-transferase